MHDFMQFIAQSFQTIVIGIIFQFIAVYRIWQISNAGEQVYTFSG